MKRAAAGSAVLTAASLLWLGQAALLADAVGRIAAGEGVAAVLPHAAGVLALGLIRAGCDTIGARLVFQAARAEVSRLRDGVVRSLAARSPLNKDRPASGLAASALAEQAEAILPYLTRFLPARQRCMLVPPAILACIFPLSWVAGLLLLLAAPLIPIFMALIGWRAKAASAAQLAQLGGMNAFLLDRLRGLATIRALGAVDATATRLRADADSLRERSMKVLRIAFLSSSVLELFAALGVAMIAVYVGFHLLGQINFGTWSGRLSLAEGLFILLLAPAFFEPLRELSAAWHDRAAGKAALDGLEALSRQGLPLPGADTATPAAGIALAKASGLRVQALRFTHTGQDRPVFRDFSLDIAAGEHVAIMAPSGGGKSTLLSLLAGLALPQAGRILIDGLELTGDSAAALRHRMVWIGQDPHIFAGSLSRNVTLGRAAPADAISNALDFAKLSEVAARLGLAPVGEKGLGLSGGEALRLALARIALLPDAGLILADEPTAHLDHQTARDIADGLIALASGRTLILATHDPVLAARMGRVIRLDDLRLREAAE